MAKLHSYFVLCPLLDRKSFLGASLGRDLGDVIVTLGRNVVNKYRLSDQKQVGGWTSKDHITAAVVYDKDEDQYVGVFNNNTLKMWKDNTESLEKIKKYKFSTQIFKVITNGESSLVVFSNGNCAALQYAIEQRKAGEEKPIIRSGDIIVDLATYCPRNDPTSQHICYIVQNSKGNLEIVTCALQSDLCNLVRSKLVKHKVSREETGVRVVGKVITVDEPTVYFLWSDSKIYSFDLVKSEWKLSGSVPWISTKSHVSMEWMGENHLILFGSDLHEDGAVIVAFNVALGVGSCRYPMKMYCEKAKLYCFNERLILETGNHLGMLPYALETSRSLSSLLATHEILSDDYTELADWGVGAVPECDAEGEFQELLKKGMTEQSIVQQLLPPLLVKGQGAKVLQVIKQFTDVPEDIIVKLLDYVIRLYDYDDSILQNESLFQKFYEDHMDQSNFLNYIFSLPFSDAILIPHLRDGLDLREASFLLTYICHLLEDDSDSGAFGVDYERKILEWCALLMDAFYQQYLITNNENVTMALDYTNRVVAKLMERLDEISDMLPLLNSLLNQNKKVNDFVEPISYSIEVMKLL